MHQTSTRFQSLLYQLHVSFLLRATHKVPHNLMPRGFAPDEVHEAFECLFELVRSWINRRIGS
jgi:hypothetical protein